MLIPLRTDRPRLRPAYLTVVLIVFNVLLHAYSDFGAGVIPLTLVLDGQRVEVAMPRLIAEWGIWGSRPTVAAFFTHMFVHGDWIHLIGNMLFLWLFGSLIEDVLRPWGMAFLYISGGILAAAAHIALSAAVGDRGDVPMVGASGAIAAIMGLFMLRFRLTQVQMFYWFWFRVGTFWVQSLWMLLIWIVLEVAQGVMAGGGGVAHWAHVGGFVAGAIAAPLTGSISAARHEYVSDDPATNVEYLRRREQVAVHERALAADPGNAYHMRRAAAALRDAGDHGPSAQMYLRALDRFAHRGMLDQALDVFREMGGLAAPGCEEMTAETLAMLARHIETARPADAAELYVRITTRHPTRPEAEWAWIRLSVLYGQAMGRPSEALRCLQEFQARYPHSQWAADAAQARAALEAELRPRASNWGRWNG